MFSLIRLTVRRAREERLAQAAGGLTFTTLLSLVPLLVVSFAAFTRFPAIRAIGEAIRAHLLQGLLPPDISRTVLKHLAQFSANAGGLPLLGFLFVVASAFAMMLSVENTLNRIWRVKKNRPLHRRLGLHAVMLIAGLPLLGASLWATSYVLMVSRGLAGVPASASVALNLAPLLLGVIGLAALFHFVPNAKVRRRDAIAGAVLASVAFELGKQGLALYLLHVPTYRTMYGAFAPLLVLLIWVYFSWLVMLAAAVVAANLPRAGQPARRLKRA